MVIYQVLDEENHPIAEYPTFESAIQDADDLTLWDADHYFHVETLHIEES